MKAQVMCYGPPGPRLCWRGIPTKQRQLTRALITVEAAQHHVIQWHVIDSGFSPNKPFVLSLTERTAYFRFRGVSKNSNLHLWLEWVSPSRGQAFHELLVTFETGELAP